MKNNSAFQVEDESALTELNLCSLFSGKKKHVKAKRHAENAIAKLKSQEQTEENQSLLAIAYFNLGCQQEFLKDLESSLKSYLAACKIETNKLD